MSTNRHPSGTSIGGQWAPGASGEVEMSLDDAFDDQAQTQPQSAAEVSEVLSGSEHDRVRGDLGQLGITETRAARDYLVRASQLSPNLQDDPEVQSAVSRLYREEERWSDAFDRFGTEDPSEVKELMGKRIASLPEGRVKDHEEELLTGLYRSDHPDPQVGIGRLVGNNDACRSAEAYVDRRHRSVDRHNRIVGMSRQLREHHPDAHAVRINDTWGRDITASKFYETEGGLLRKLSPKARKGLDESLSEAKIDARFVNRSGVRAFDLSSDEKSAVINVKGMAEREKTSTRPFTAADAASEGDYESVRNSFEVSDGDRHYVEHDGSIWSKRMRSAGA